MSSKKIILFICLSCLFLLPQPAYSKISKGDHSIGVMMGSNRELSTSTSYALGLRAGISLKFYT